MCVILLFGYTISIIFKISEEYHSLKLAITKLNSFLFISSPSEFIFPTSLFIIDIIFFSISSDCLLILLHSFTM